MFPRATRRWRPTTAWTQQRWMASQTVPPTGTGRTSDYSKVDTNQTTFAIKNKDRVFREPEFRYGWPVDKDNIQMRFQNLRKAEAARLYEKLKLGMLQVKDDMFASWIVSQRAK